MGARICKALESSTLLLSAMASFLLYAVSGSTASPVKWTIRSPRERQDQVPTESSSASANVKEVKAVLEKMAAAGIARPSTVADVRKAYLFYPKLSGTPEHVFRVEDRQIPGPAGSLTIRVYSSNPAKGMPILVFFHGGGFVAGDLDSYDIPLRSVTNRCECTVVSVAYRLAPEAKYPAAPEDAYAATKWVAEHAAEIGGDPARMAVGGDGAGGNLAAVVALMAREHGSPHLAFQVLIYPMLDTSTMRPSWFTESDAPSVTRDVKHGVLSAYLPIAASLSDPFVAPIRAEKFTNLPNALVIAYGGEDPMRVEAEEYVRRLKVDGVAATISLYPNAVHGFFLMAGDLAEGKKCINEVATAVKSALSAK
jgi:acetyl esterase